MRQGQNIDKYLDLVVNPLKIVPKDLGKRVGDLEFRGRNESIQITALLMSAIKLKRILETCSRLISSKRSLTNSGVIHIYQPPRSGRI